MEKLKAFTIIIWLVIPVIINAQPCVNINCRDTTICKDNEYLPLNLCNPVGGMYYGEFVDSLESKFKCDEAFIGENLVYYTVNGEICHFIITLRDYPTSGTLTGDNKVCKGETVTYYSNGIQNVDSLYIWSFNSNTFLTTIPQLDLTISTNFINGSLTVKGKNKNCGDQGAISSELPITVNNKPSPIITGSNNVCVNARVNYISNNDYSTYKWTLEGSADSIASQNTLKTVTVYWKGQSDNLLKLTVKDIEGCIGDTIINVTKSGIAPKPSKIWRFGYNLLVCSDSTATTYKWYRNGQTTLSDTLSYYYVNNIDSPDTYYVETCKDACCNISDQFSFYKKNGSGKNAKVETSFSIYPIPAFDKITVRKLVPFADKYSYCLFDMFGKLQSSGYGSGLETNIDISKLASGIYFIRIDDGFSLNEVYKIIINR